MSIWIWVVNMKVPVIKICTAHQVIQREQPNALVQHFFKYCQLRAA